MTKVSKYFTVIMIASLFLSVGCDLGTYNKRMTDDAVPVKAKKKSNEDTEATDELESDQPESDDAEDQPVEEDN